MTSPALARAVWGTALVTVPRPLLRRLDPAGADDRAVAVARVLGVRHLVQAALTGALPCRPVLLAGAVADAAHGASMLALAGWDPGRRRVALVDAALALGWGAASWAGAGRVR
ncbi:hypothetical protein AB2L27_17775 [Kineococcus sp. LSe6-4]|uniref:Uncharacterized protein n=1 Tax=Kineococcus halophytocola TaxID=3234027 RepID=A0ABV4H883_9ACTN